jgi:hypothetical protein
LADHARLREADRLLFLVQQGAFHAESLHAAEAREEQEADGRQICRVLSLFRGYA